MSYRSAIKVFLILCAGYLTGYFFGSELSSPPYIAPLNEIPLEMNSPEDVSWLVKSYLPKDPKEAFEVVANSSNEISSSKSSICDCTYIFLRRPLRRLPLPDKKLSVYFRLEDGELKYEGAEIVNWFL